MLNLGKLNLKDGAAPYRVPYPNTLLEIIHPGARLGIVEISRDPDDRRQMERLLGREYKGMQLDFATGSRKHGDFIITDQALGKRYWASPEEALSYGSLLLTTCVEAPQQQPLIVKVVLDGEQGTADCHAKIRPDLTPLFGMQDRAVQFRLASGKWLAKGTAAPGDPSQLPDLVIPTSAFKSRLKPQPGLYLCDTTWGNVAYSEKRRVKVSYQVLQWFSYETIMADLGDHIEAEITRLQAASQSPKAAAELLQPDSKAEYILLKVIKADVHDQLARHPWIVNGLARMLRRRWLHLATGAGLYATSLMAMPDESLPDNTVASPDLKKGPVIAFRYPIRNWADIRIWDVDFTVHQDIPGTVWMNSKTARQCGADFDGDTVCFWSAADYPRHAAEIRSWEDTRTPPDIPKATTRNASDWDNFPRVAVNAAECDLGRVTNMITKACAAGRLDLCNDLAVQSQIAVDTLKFSVRTDRKLLRAARESLPDLAWLSDLKSDSAFLDHPLAVDDTATDTISRLIAHVASAWTPPRSLARPLEEFAYLFPKTEHYQQTAKKLNQAWGKLIADYLQGNDESSLRDVFTALDNWVAGLKEPEQMAMALWHEIHRPRRQETPGTGSLVFHAFPSLVCDRLQGPPAPPETFTITGLKYHEWGATLPDLPRQAIVSVEETVLNDQIRSLARVDGRTVGIVSSETPTPPGLFLRRLRWSGAGCVYADAL